MTKQMIAITLILGIIGLFQSKVSVVFKPITQRLFRFFLSANRHQRRHNAKRKKTNGSLDLIVTEEVEVARPCSSDDYAEP